SKATPPCTRSGLRSSKGRIQVSEKEVESREVESLKRKGCKGRRKPKNACCTQSFDLCTSGPDRDASIYGPCRRRGASPFQQQEILRGPRGARSGLAEGAWRGEGPSPRTHPGCRRVSPSRPRQSGRFPIAAREGFEEAGEVRRHRERPQLG